MRRIVLALLLGCSLAVTAQSPSANMSHLQVMEDSLKVYGHDMIMDSIASRRFINDSMFIRTLVRTLKTPYSFYFPFNSLQTVSRIYAPDSSFRIFSWQFERDEAQYRQRGAIQVKTTDGSLQLYPLLDMSDYTDAPQDSIRSGSNWIGAIYYAVIMKQFNNKKFYTLLGYDDNNKQTTKKWIDILTFNEAGAPVFGGPFFNYKTGDEKPDLLQARFCLEYKKDARARLTYDRDMDMIMYDHLVSESNEPSDKSTMVPDGDYQGFKWANGKWQQVDKVFDFKLQDGQAPVPVPLKDASGKSDENKLLEQSEKNRQKQQATTPAKPAPAKKPA